MFARCTSQLPAANARPADMKDFLSAFISFSLHQRNSPWLWRKIAQFKAWLSVVRCWRLYTLKAREPKNAPEWRIFVNLMSAQSSNAAFQLICLVERRHLEIADEQQRRIVVNSLAKHQRNSRHEFEHTHMLHGLCVWIVRVCNAHLVNFALISGSLWSANR